MPHKKYLIVSVSLDLRLMKKDDWNSTCGVTGIQFQYFITNDFPVINSKASSNNYISPIFFCMR